jgi:hypothetical protein
MAYHRLSDALDLLLCFVYMILATVVALAAEAFAILSGSRFACCTADPLQASPPRAGQGQEPGALRCGGREGGAQAPGRAKLEQSAHARPPAASCRSVARSGAQPGGNTRRASHSPAASVSSSGRVASPRGRDGHAGTGARSPKAPSPPPGTGASTSKAAAVAAARPVSDPAFAEACSLMRVATAAMHPRWADAYALEAAWAPLGARRPGASSRHGPARRGRGAA